MASTLTNVDRDREGGRMSLPMACPTCRAVRGPNSRFCHQCGHDYEAMLHGAAASVPSIPASRVEIAISLPTAIKLGFGMALGALIVGLIGSIISLGLIGAAIDALLRPLR